MNPPEGNPSSERNFILKQSSSRVRGKIILAIFLTVIVAIAAALIVPKNQDNVYPSPTTTPTLEPGVKTSSDFSMKKFSSEEEFKNYIQEGQSLVSYQAVSFLETPSAREDALKSLAPSGALPVTGGGGGGAERVSETNVQVKGIDEPDMVKTDGKKIYFSPQSWGYWGSYPVLRESVGSLPVYSQPKTKLINAFPPGDLGEDSEIEKSGDLLLTDKKLIIFSQDGIYGFDVSDPKSPVQSWKLKLESKTQIVTSRLFNNKIYLVTSDYLDSIHPCPVKPLSRDGETISIECIDIYHPIENVQVDTTFVAMVINPANGEVEKKLSFVGSTGTSTVYMSAKSLYIAYPFTAKMSDFYYRFLKEKASDLVPAEIISRLEKIASYDISEQSKISEIYLILDRYQNSLSDDERLRMENELSNRLSDYLKTYRRELEKTGLTKIGLGNFEILSTGSFSGTLLNQFSMDEYNDFLRVATTVGGGWSFGQRGESANDIYVLDGNLKIKGSVKDLALGEKIYSARFVEDRGYLVTFKQIDPFFVLDLSSPENPAVKGQLKIPGFSSYLHPLDKNKVLGIGQESSQVKVAIFDVTSADTPIEKAKYLLDEYWSEISSTHHAFLLDHKHDIFFLPGSKGGYIFSFAGDQLELKKAVADIVAKRAIYLDDYLYVIGENKLVVLNEADWQEVNQLEL